MEPIIILIIILLFISYIKNNFKLGKKKDRYKNISKRKLRQLVKQELSKTQNQIEISDFKRQKLRLERQGFETEGVYIFTNAKNNKKYVGQSVNILNRVNTHLKGRGSEDLHRDIAKGDKFTIQLVKLGNSGFKNLNDLERYYIALHNSYYKGYNKTRGNK